MGARRGGGGGGARGGTCPPPLEIQKYGGPHKDNLTRKIKKKIIFKKLSEETELRAPHLISEETDMRGPPIVSKETDLRGPTYSMQSNLSKGAPTYGKRRSMT